MRVKRVVVDELPENCDPCPFPFAGNDRPGWQCSIMEVTNDEGHYDIDENTRPDWCPLELERSEEK